MAVSTGAALIGSAVIGGIMGNNASKNAAQAQTDAANAANLTQAQQYAQTRKDNEPWRTAGASALAQMQDNSFQKDFTMSDFQADPGYAFRMAEGQKALERSAAARGGLNSGATAKALTRYGQDFGSQEYQNAYTRFNADRDRRFNRLSSIAGTGQTANAQNSAMGANYANNVSQNQIGIGNANAAAIVGGQNAINQGVGQGINTWMNYQLMNQMKPQVPAQQDLLSGGTYNNYSNIG